MCCSIEIAESQTAVHLWRTRVWAAFAYVITKQGKTPLSRKMSWLIQPDHFKTLLSVHQLFPCDNIVSDVRCVKFAVTTSPQGFIVTNTLAVMNWQSTQAVKM